MWCSVWISGNRTTIAMAGQKNDSGEEKQADLPRSKLCI